MSQLSDAIKHFLRKKQEEYQGMPGANAATRDLRMGIEDILAEFEDHRSKGRHERPESEPQGPVVMVTWRDADEMARWQVRHHHQAMSGSYLVVGGGDAMTLGFASVAAQSTLEAYETYLHHQVRQREDALDWAEAGSHKIPD